MNNKTDASTQNQKQTEDSGKRFKIVVEHGELYLECIDKFEDIFEISQDLINPKDRKDQKVELTDVLDPYLFENHRDIVNALFEVYFDVSEIYLKRFYDEHASQRIRSEARERVERRYQIGKYASDKAPAGA